MTLSLEHVVIDATDAAALAGFYARLLGRPVDPGAGAQFATVGRDPSIGPVLATPLMFLAVPEPRQGKNRLHLDLVASDPEADIAAAIDAGAERIGDFDEYGAVWTTLRDPEGNLFDIARPHAG